MQVIILGGGCFWCTEAVYVRISGVLGVKSGYMGGRRPSPSYESICTGVTGHAEVVRVEFDPAEVSLDALYDVFFATHDPTTLNRQGADTGTQYRSVAFCLGDDQLREARSAAERWSAAHPNAGPVVTEFVLLPAEEPVPSEDRPPEATFWPAEDDHHRYFERSPGAGYCQFVVRGKVEKSQKAYPDLQSGTVLA